MDGRRVFGLVLAGGEGKRLMPLTADRAKPAVPFGGHYRLVDFALSNLVNAGYLRIVVLTQYKSHSLDRHVTTSGAVAAPRQLRDAGAGPAAPGPHWFAGSADAIYQSLNLIHDERPDYVCVFGADHIYRIDPRQMVARHVEWGAGVTVAGIRVPLAEADQFGVIEPAADGHTIARFREKPDDAVGLPDAPDQAYASMGIYVFTANTLVEAVTEDAADEQLAPRPRRQHDPRARLARRGARLRLPLERRARRGRRGARLLARRRDARRVLRRAHGSRRTVPVFNLYNQRGRSTLAEPLPPAKFVVEEEGRTGRAVNSMVCAGVIVSGGSVRRSILSPGVHVHSYAEVERSVLLHGVEIGRHAIVRNAILDKTCGRRARRSASTSTTTASGSSSPTAASSRSARAPSSMSEARLRVALLTREYPPEVYGGAGVHVEYLARELDRLVDLTVHCFGADRRAAGPRRSPTARGSLRGARRTRPRSKRCRSTSRWRQRSRARSSSTATPGTRTSAGHLAKLVHGIPHVATVHSLEPLRPWKAEQLGGGYAVSRWCERTALEAADAVIAVSAEQRRDLLACYPAVDPER